MNNEKGEVTVAVALILGWIVAGLSVGITHTVMDTQEILRYNYMEKEFEYAHPKAQLKYNYLEKRWEFVR